MTECGCVTDCYIQVKWRFGSWVEIYADFVIRMGDNTRALRSYTLRSNFKYFKACFSFNSVFVSYKTGITLWCLFGFWQKNFLRRNFQIKLNRKVSNLLTIAFNHPILNLEYDQSINQSIFVWQQVFPTETAATVTSGSSDLNCWFKSISNSDLVLICYVDLCLIFLTSRNKNWRLPD